MVRCDHRVKHIVQVIGHPADVSGQQRRFHGVLVRTAGNGRLVQLPVPFRGGHGEIRLYHHKNALRHGGQLADTFSPALHHGRAADDAEGYVAAHLGAQLR